MVSKKYFALNGSKTKKKTDTLFFMFFFNNAVVLIVTRKMGVGQPFIVQTVLMWMHFVICGALFGELMISRMTFTVKYIHLIN